jgi:molybdate transport system ATP-binding protein
VAVSVYPWEIAVGPATEEAHGSAQNRLVVEVLSLTAVGNRVRLGLAGPQPLAAEITQAAADQLGLRNGARVTASWKAAATRLVRTD